MYLVEVQFFSISGHRGWKVEGDIWIYLSKFTAKTASDCKCADKMDSIFVGI